MKKINNFNGFKSVNEVADNSKIASDFLEVVFETGKITDKSYKMMKENLSSINLSEKKEIDVKRTVLNEIFKAGNISVGDYSVIIKKEGI